MGNNKKKKLALFIIMMISLSLIISSVAMIINTYNANDGMWTSYMHEDKKILETNFYKSRAFEFKVLRPITSKLVSMLEKEDNEYEKSQLRLLENVKFIVANNDTGEYYTNIGKYNNIFNNPPNENTSKKYTEINGEMINEILGNYKAYIEIMSDRSNKVYNKTVSSESTISREDAYNELFDLIPSDNIEIFISFGDLEASRYTNMPSDTYEFYNLSVKNTINYFIILVVSIVILIVVSILYRRLNIKLFERNSKELNLYNKIPVDMIFIFLLIDINILDTAFSTVWEPMNIIKTTMINSISILLFIMIVYMTYRSYKSYDKKLNILKNTLVFKLISMTSRFYKKVTNSSENVRLIPNIIILTVLLIIFISVSLIKTYTTDYWYNHQFVLLQSIVIPSVALILFTSYIVKQLFYLGEIIETTNKIKDGDINVKVEIKGNNDITKLAQNINSIGQGLDIAIEQQVKSERMKAELITNVSHDLKTPLTSIMNYIQLINKEENISPEHIKDYITVIDNKSKRLKVLIEDLFEASKASSGNIELNIEKIDIGQLLRQSIGEMEEKLLENNLDIKLNISEEKIYIDADGRRMYRVLENLLSNISKYTLPNTRVYIDLFKDNNKVNLVMKNISAYELNFDPSEIVERFKRGDESRNTEGSGLGLSIAKDLVNLQGGEFDIEIDGDLFKVILKF